ncbi:hypothetical protein [Bacillus wiedmannii]|uniref:hypothetical protein n=1 Tax=Bacillus wiedmannii TaxID=1890302 RepID=UPI000CD81D7B|nr:hypothetical protein [Bacillus wiedmannii]MBG9828518.1 hypothetical protein [Bacillus wiedmannii]UOB95790.1 hypothetical protein BTI679_31340 [Bacillus wiedmannii]
MRTHVKTKEIYIAGKKYLVGSLLEKEELVRHMHEGRKVLYTKSFDVYQLRQRSQDGTYTRKLYSIHPQGVVIEAFRTMSDLVESGAYKLIPAWMEA